MRPDDDVCNMYVFVYECVCTHVYSCMYVSIYMYNRRMEGKGGLCKVAALLCF